MEKIDFIGLREDREVIILEAKNKQAKLNEKDGFQLEYYIDEEFKNAIKWMLDKFNLKNSDFPYQRLVIAALIL